jgi:hypothetical protein
MLDVMSQARLAGRVVIAADGKQCQYRRLFRAGDWSQDHA